ncbi:MAG: hypothetical protein NTU89_00930 [Candidatus Dependentiae bacterium]|nr:hypothetical protein [Candidatus Dependentiae bacterium]
MSKVYLSYFVAIIFLSTAFLAKSSSNEVKDRPVKFISLDDMKKSFLWANSYYFLEKTKIEKIIDDKITAREVEIRLDFYLEDYTNYLKTSSMKPYEKVIMKNMMEAKKHDMLKILLKDDPEALAFVDFNIQLSELSKDLEKIKIKFNLK